LLVSKRLGTSSTVAEPWAFASRRIGKSGVFHTLFALLSLVMPTIFDLHLSVEESHWAIFLRKDVLAIENDHDGDALEFRSELDLVGDCDEVRPVDWDPLRVCPIRGIIHRWGG
jgi:hypothetical protein